MSENKPQRDPNRARLRGRPFGLTPQGFINIINAVRVGASRKDAAIAAGISRAAFQKYLSIGKTLEKGLPEDVLKRFLDIKAGIPPILTPKQEKLICKDLLDMVIRAESEMVVNHLKLIEKAALGQVVIERRVINHTDGTNETVEKYQPAQWAASAWKLERKRPDEFVKQDRVAHEVKNSDSEPARIVIVSGPEKIEPPADPEPAKPQQKPQGDSQ